MKEPDRLRPAAFVERNRENRATESRFGKRGYRVKILSIFKI